MSMLSDLLSARATAKGLGPAAIAGGLVERGHTVAPSAVSQWLSGATRPDMARLDDLATILDLAPGDLTRAAAEGRR